MNTETQCHQIALHLTQGKTLTSLEALRLYGCLRLSGRIYDLKQRGLDIEMKMVSTLTGKHVAEYSIKKP